MSRYARPFTEYPPRFYETIEHFFTSIDPVTFNHLSAREAFSTRNRFYDLFRAIRRAATSRPSDSYLTSLMDIARDLTIEIRPGSARGEEPVTLTIRLHPLSKLYDSGPPGFPSASPGPSASLPTLPDTSHTSLPSQDTTPSQDPDLTSAVESLFLKSSTSKSD